MKVIAEIELTGDFDEELMTEEEKEGLLNEVLYSGAENFYLTGKVIRILEFK
ncbi:Uncharacterised protein [[Flavobacterium] thermophilum]|nr:Uncharacterised protein [[Flavobacterium] thermophilum]